MTEMTSEARHARLVGEIKRRLGEIPRASQPGCRCSAGCRQMTDRPGELEALLEIVERTGDWLTSYDPEDIAYIMAKDVLSACEKILGPDAGRE
jgi:hypothetical protein